MSINTSTIKAYNLARESGDNSVIDEVCEAYFLNYVNNYICSDTYAEYLGINYFKINWILKRGRLFNNRKHEV